MKADQRAPGQMSPAWIQNDLGLAAKRLGLTLSQDQYAAAEALLRKGGVTPIDAVKNIANPAAIFAEKFNLPDAATVKARVAARNASGQWQP